MKKLFRNIRSSLRGDVVNHDEHLAVLREMYEWKDRAQYLEGLRREDAELAKRNVIPVAGFDNLAHEPTDAKERVAYAARVGSFYDDVLRDKVRTSIAEIRELLSSGSMVAGLHNMERGQYDSFLRGMEAGLWKIHEWAITLQGELRNENQDGSI
jgi:hypothetical protein